MAFCSNCGAEVFGKFCSKCGNNCGNEQDLVKTQENQKNENVKETIAKLYTLRAGISYSVKQFEKHKNIKNRHKSIIGSNEAMLKENNSKIRDKKIYINSQKILLGAQLENRRKTIEREKALCKKNKKKYDKETMHGVFMGILIFFGLLSFGLFFQGFEFLARENTMVVGIASICAFPIILALFILNLVLKKKDHQYFVEWCDKSNRKQIDLEEVNKKIIEQGNAQKEIQSAGLEVDRLEKTNEQLSIAVAESRRKLETEPIPYLVFANGVCDVLVREYSALIDTRDWANLDLVIFYFETGRAKSMQEALQLVDRQRQNDRIVEAINEASYQICNTINAGIEHIQNVVIGCAKVLSTQLGEIASQQKALGREISNLQISASSMEKALKAKSNVSSNQLAEDIHQMRIYAENEAIRKRNS